MKRTFTNDGGRTYLCLHHQIGSASYAERYPLRGTVLTDEECEEITKVLDRAHREVELRLTDIGNLSSCCVAEILRSHPVTGVPIMVCSGCGQDAKSYNELAEDADGS